MNVARQQPGGEKKTKGEKLGSDLTIDGGAPRGSKLVAGS
jgi:hypothetical protein